MQKKTILIASTLTVLLLAGVFFGCRKIRYLSEHIVARPDSTDVSIFIEPDNTATRAAANYLSLAVERALRIELNIVTSKEADRRYICIVCGTEQEPEDTEASEGERVYSISLAKDDVIIYVPVRNRCFGAVKAITNRWLQEDCGLKRGDDLRISRAMIDKQLSWLSTAVEGEIRILTQNLCYSDDGEGRTVEERAARFIQLVEDYQPDLIGTQECTLQWLQLLWQALGDRYDFYGCSIWGPDAKDQGWDDAILYRRDRFAMKDGETFWLSNTPSEPATKLNYKGAYRICTWALLLDSETGKTLQFSNTHLQNTQNGSELYSDVRARQAETLLLRLRKGNSLTSSPCFLTGDFNGGSQEPFYTRLTQFYGDSRLTAVTNSSAVDYTYQDYGSAQALIDYCFHSPKSVTVLDYHILDDQYGGYISDHYGILVTAVLN